jgi:hypothetical protein
MAHFKSATVVAMLALFSTMSAPMTAPDTETRVSWCGTASRNRVKHLHASHTAWMTWRAWSKICGTRVVLRGGGKEESEGGRVPDGLPPGVRGLVERLDSLDDSIQVSGDSENDSGTLMKGGVLRAERRPAPAHTTSPSDLEEHSDSDGVLPPMDDMREAEALEKALKKWKENMQERIGNPRIALMVCGSGSMLREHQVLCQSESTNLREPVNTCTHLKVTWYTRSIQSGNGCRRSKPSTTRRWSRWKSSKRRWRRTIQHCSLTRF